MSLCVAWVGSQRAVLAVDSQALGADGERRHFSKSVTLPAARAAVAAVPADASFFIAALADELWSASDFDELVAALPGRCRTAVDGVARLAAAGHMPALREPEQVLVCVGWSASRRRPAGFTFSQGADFEPEEIGTFYASPWDAKFDRLGAIAGVPGIVRLLEAQLALVRELAPGGAAGPPFIVCEVSERGVTVTRHEIEQQPALRTAFGA